ncbi:unnamed protein product [Diatraea saccharalis]|uniref:FLYWCH-type domain-containing protein n=1 Tax=Diatraea saccharalis TaxID=40085 RepID=A0A9N9WDE0_9NEOP|nr:unnamed protein product [Diatraea saccharalis]
MLVVRAEWARVRSALVITKKINRLPSASTLMHYTHYCHDAHVWLVFIEYVKSDKRLFGVVVDRVSWYKMDNGKPLALIDGYSFVMHSRSTKKEVWRCRLQSHKRFEWIQRDDGKQLALINGYTFYKHFRSSKSEGWRCSNQAHKSCKARFFLSLDDVYWVKTNTGKALAVVNNYPFVMTNRTARTEVWRCRQQKHKRFSWLTSRTGRQVALIDNYHFIMTSRSAKHEVWRCRQQQHKKFSWIEKDDGKKLALIDGFTFFLRNRSAKSEVWRCSSHSHFRCKARFSISLEDVEWVEKEDGTKLAVIDGFTFFRQKRNITTQSELWRCSKKSRMGFTWVRKTCGKELAIVNGYTFYLHKVNSKTNTWKCTNGKCKGRLTTTNDMYRSLVRSFLTHTHQPPQISTGAVILWQTEATVEPGEHGSSDKRLEGEEDGPEEGRADILRAKDNTKETRMTPIRKFLMGYDDEVTKKSLYIP